MSGMLLDLLMSKSAFDRNRPKPANCVHAPTAPEIDASSGFADESLFILLGGSRLEQKDVATSLQNEHLVLRPAGGAICANKENGEGPCNPIG